MGPTPYPFNMSSHLELSKALYDLYRSMKIMWRTTSLMAVTC